MKINFEKILLYFIDGILIITGLYASYLIRFDFYIPISYLEQLYYLIPLLLWIRFISFSYYHSYQILLRFFSYHDIVYFIRPFLFGTIVIVFANIFRNFTVILFFLSFLTYVVTKKQKFQDYLENIRKKRFFKAPFLMVLIIILIVSYWLNLEYHEELISVKEGIRSNFLFANYPSTKAIPRTIIIMEFLLNYLFLSFVRTSYRYLLEKKNPKMGKSAIKVIIFGAGKTGELVVKELMQRVVENPLEIIGFIDDDETKWNKKIRGFSIYGGWDRLEELKKRYGITDVIIAIPSFRGEKLESFIKNCHELGLKFKLVPKNDDLYKNTHFRVIREVKIEDILHRNIQTVISEVNGNYIENKTVLITGAGGSIGSEICRQISRFNPAKLIILGKGENSIYQIFGELREYFPGDRIHQVIGDICDISRINWVFNHFQPELVFHCAAHKHVPLMEKNPGEALKNNFIGTANLARIAHFNMVKRFIFISTDKAVNPINIMGASKRLAERFLQTQFKDSETQFVIARFGNVLGSRGSVVPLFLRQIRSGGPVTVTDKRVVRYFITIPEAVSLVLKAAEVGDNGDIYILDMGQQINILKLAENLIYLTGLKPYVDIPIQFIGLREGEKLSEELATESEGVYPSKYKGLYKADTDNNGKHDFVLLKNKIESFLAVEDIQSCYQLIQDVIPTLK